MITIPGELIENLAASAGAHRVHVTCWDGGDAFVILAEPDSRTMEMGTILVAGHAAEVRPAAIGSPDDVVRVVVALGTGGSRDTSPLGSFGPCAAAGYALRGDDWCDTPVQIVPLRSELFSRVNGLFETDIVADQAVFVVGLGSGGAPIAVELAKSGVADFVLMDPDRLEVGNVVRHLGGLSHVGRYKTKFIRDAIKDKNPCAEVRTLEERVSWDNVDLVRNGIRRSDLVICATDNRESRTILNKICVEEQRTLIIAGAFRRAYGGQILRIRPHTSLCYQCFLQTVPEHATDQEISNTASAQRLAYTDRPVPIEPGLSTDIAPISLMVVKLAIQELLRGKATTLRSLDEDLAAAWYLWLNRREAGTDYERLEPLGFDVAGLHVLGWYGIPAERNPECPVCGSFTRARALQDGIKIEDTDLVEFVSSGQRSQPR